MMTATSGSRATRENTAPAGNTTAIPLWSRRASRMSRRSVRRRSCDGVGCTNPAWTAQQLREAFPWNQTPRYLIHDRDLAFQAMIRTTKAMGIEDVRTAPQSPWQNAYVERFIGSVRRESSITSLCSTPQGCARS